MHKPTTRNKHVQTVHNISKREKKSFLKICQKTKVWVCTLLIKLHPTIIVWVSTFGIVTFELSLSIVVFYFFFYLKGTFCGSPTAKYQDECWRLCLHENQTACSYSRLLFWIKHKLKSRFTGEISKPQIHRSHHPSGRKQRWIKQSLDESERGGWKSWLKTQHSEN